MLKYLKSGILNDKNNKTRKFAPVSDLIQIAKVLVP